MIKWNLKFWTVQFILLRTEAKLTFGFVHTPYELGWYIYKKKQQSHTQLTTICKSTDTEIWRKEHWI